MEQFENEIWRTVKINPNYMVSNYGRVKTIDHPVWCKKNNSYSIRKGRLCVLSNNNSKKYYRVGIQINNKQKHFAVHRIVAEAFIPNPDDLPQVNHIDGNKSNNKVSNLEWCDNAYNQQHAIKSGLKSIEKMSKHSSFRKLNDEQIVFIKNLANDFDFSKRGNKKYFCKTLQKMFELKSENTILWIINNVTNRFVNQDIVQTTNFYGWKNQFHKIYNDFKEKSKPLIEYADELNVNRKTFHAMHKRLGGDLQKTIDFFKNKKR